MKESYALLERRRKALLKKLSEVGPFIMASPYYPKIKCGNPVCKCAKDPDARHEKRHLSWMSAGRKSGTQYVPVNLREEVLEWIENYWVIKEYMKEMSELSRKMISLYAKTQKRGEKKGGVLKKRKTRKKKK